MYFSSCLFRKVLFLCIRNLFYIDIDNTRNNFSVSKFFEGLLLLLSEFFFYPLLGRARFRDWCWAAIRLSYRPEPSGHTVHEEVDGLDIGGQHGRRFVLLRHTHRLHRPPYPICTNRGGNVRHRCEGGWARPRLFLGTSFREGGYRCRELNAESCGVVGIPLMIRPLRRTYVVVVRKTDELLCGGHKWVSRFEAPCICTRWTGERRVEQVSRRRPRDSVAPLRRSSAGWMPARIGRLSACVGRRHPVTNRKASLMVESIRQVWALRHQTGEQYSAVECTVPGLGWLFAMLLLQHPNQSQQAASWVRWVMSASCEVTRGVGDTWATCPTLLRDIWARSRRAGFRCWSWLSAHS